MFRKQAFFFFFISVFVFPQTELTLNDAILKRWTTLYPETKSNLQWKKDQDSFSYTQDSCLLIFNEKNNLINKFCLEDLKGINDLSKFPSIEWVSNHSFKFEHKNEIFLFNTKRGQKPISYLKYPDNCKNKDYNFRQNLLAYTSGNNLFISNSDSVFQINEQEESVVYGQAVHRYEFGIYKGTFWSPNGNKLAFYKKNEKQVDDYPLLIISDTTTKQKEIKYPMAGDVSHYVSLGIYDVDTKRTIYIKTGFPKDQYLTNISWGPFEKYIYVAVLNRDQNYLKLNKYDAETGEYIKTLFEEKDEKYVHPLHPMIFIDNKRFLWRSEKGGYDHFYLYSEKGKLIKKVTSGNIVVKDFIGYKNETIYFSAYSPDGLDIHLYSFSLDKKNKKSQKSLTKKFPGVHKLKMSPSGNFFIDEFSNLKLPRLIQIINTRGDHMYNLLDAQNPLEGYDLGDIELLQIETENNVLLNARMVKPFNFDENQSYPVLIYVYNGPQIQLLTNSWILRTPLWMCFLANKGYLVFTIDGRGSENRGKEFEQIIFRELGKIEMEDQIKGYNYLTSLPYVDKDRIALHGWSYGGFMITNLLLTYPDLFTCGVAGGPVIDWSLYEIMYTERYMDTPIDNTDGYQATNLKNKSQALKKPLLMIHGLMDDVVVIQHSLKFVEECVDKNIPIDYFVYPNHAHNVRGKDRLHLMNKVINYILKNNE